MTPNQRLLDRLIRHKVYLLGFAKHIVEKVMVYLDATRPDMRRALLDIFGPGSGETRLIARLRDAESRLFGIRARAWNKSYAELINLLIEMAEEEPKVMKVAIPAVTLPDVNVRSRVYNALSAGQTIRDWWQSLKDADWRRIVGQLRVSILGGEKIEQTLARIIGGKTAKTISAVAVQAKNAVAAVVNTAVSAISGVMRRVVVEANDVLFDWELWVSILDSRTTPGCRRLDGQQFPVGKGPQPGYHLFCRSDRIPILSDGGEYNIGTYTEWSKLQPLTFRRYAGTGEFKPKALKSLSYQDVREREERDES